MSRFTPRPAVRTGQKARIAIAGPSGSGKTWDALTLAVVLADGEPVLVLDTERGSSALYSDRFTFEVIEWTPPFDPRELGQEINTRGGEYGVIVIDSLSHFWEGEGGTRDIVDAAAARSKGNSFAGWKEGTPAQDAMVQAILAAPCHVIATMRSKTEYVLEERNGKQVPRKVGMAPIQRAGVEFEFTVTCEVDRDHTLIVDKSRCYELSDAVFPPSKVDELGTTLASWLASNEPQPAPCRLCGEMIPGAGVDRQPLRDHLVAAHDYVRQEDGTVIAPKIADEPPTAGASSAAGPEPAPPSQHSGPATIDPAIVERLNARVDGLRDELRHACQDALAAATDNRYPNELTPADVPELSALITTFEEQQLTPQDRAMQKARQARKETAA